MKQRIDRYYSYDLGLSAALVTDGFELVSLDRTNPQKIQFIFKKNSKIDEKITAYWSNSLRIYARSYFNNIKMLKNRIYSEQK